MTRQDTGAAIPAESVIAICAGGLLIGYGLTGVVFGSGELTTATPDGSVAGQEWLGIEANGWTNGFFAAVGLLLMLGSPLRLAAKAVSALASLVLGAAAVFAMVDGGDVFGVLAANAATIVAWAAVAVVLLIAAVTPRSKPVVPDDAPYAHRARRFWRASPDCPVGTRRP